MHDCDRQTDHATVAYVAIVGIADDAFSEVTANVASQDNEV